MESGSMSKLTKEQQEVWDRLKYGLPDDTFHTAEEMIEHYSRLRAKEMADEIDKDMLLKLFQEANDK